MLRQAPQGLEVRVEGPGGSFTLQEFEGDETMKPGVLGFVDHAHTAATKSFENLVVRDGFAQ